MLNQFLAVIPDEKTSGDIASSESATLLDERRSRTHPQAKPQQSQHSEQSRGLPPKTASVTRHQPADKAQSPPVQWCKQALAGHHPPANNCTSVAAACREAEFSAFPTINGARLRRCSRHYGGAGGPRQPEMGPETGANEAQSFWTGTTSPDENGAFDGASPGREFF